MSTNPIDQAECSSRPVGLNDDEQQQFTTLEHTIEAGLRAFMRAGAALATIRAQRLYRATHATFEAYCRERWHMSDVHANRLMAASETTRLLETQPIGAVALPTSESVARPLTRLDDQAKVAAWTVAVETAPLGQPTAAHVAQVVAAFTADLDAELARNGWWLEDADGYPIRIDAETVTSPSVTPAVALTKAYQRARHRQVARERTAEAQAVAELEAQPMPAIPAALAAEGWTLHRTVALSHGVQYWAKKPVGGFFQSTQSYSDLADVLAEMRDPALPAALSDAGWQVVMVQSNWWSIERTVDGGTLRTRSASWRSFPEAVYEAEQRERQHTGQVAEALPDLPDDLVLAGWTMCQNAHGLYGRHRETAQETNAGTLAEVVDAARRMQRRIAARPELPPRLAAIGWRLERERHSDHERFCASLTLSTTYHRKGQMTLDMALRLQAGLEERIAAFDDQADPDRMPELVIKGWTLDRLRGLVHGLLSKDLDLHWTLLDDLTALANVIGA